MIFRLYHELRGGHVHCRLYSGTHDGAMGKCGEFTIPGKEFVHFGWLCRDRFDFRPPLDYDFNRSEWATDLAGRILQGVRLKMTEAEYQAAYWQVTTAIDDVFELGIKSAGGDVKDFTRPRPYPRQEPPAKEEP